MSCTCCGGELVEGGIEEQREKCSRCSIGLCRCQLTQAEEAAADAAVDRMADAAGLGDEDVCDRSCVCGSCESKAVDREEDRADVVAKAERRGE